MGFVNEKVSQEDIEKYDLSAIWNKYISMEKNKIITYRASKKAHSWVIDKENEIFLIHFAKFLDEKLPSDHERATYYTKENMFIFYFKNEFYEIRLMREKEHLTFGEKSKVLIYETTWGFKEIIPNIIMDENFKTVLKQALTVYGEDGVFNKEYTKYIINFNFEKKEEIHLFQKKGDSHLFHKIKKIIKYFYYQVLKYKS